MPVTHRKDTARPSDEGIIGSTQSFIAHVLYVLVM